MTYFLDFDRTLFDTDAFIAHLLKRPEADEFQHDSEETLADILNERAKKNALIFQEGELKQFVYDDVPKVLRHLGDEACILTFGNPALQKLKVENALADIPSVSVIYTGNIRKGEFMKERMASYGPQVVFVDDRAVELEDMATYHPHVRLFEIRRDGAQGDGRWPVIHSLAELS